MPTGPTIPAIIDAVYDSFQHNYASVDYLTLLLMRSMLHWFSESLALFEISKLWYHCQFNRTTIWLFDAIPTWISIIINNFPQHHLTLKIGVPVVLLIERLDGYLLQGHIMTGNHIGETVCIPRIVLNGTSHRWPFTLQRRQFSIRLCYAMTINKCQGQTYVAISRVSSKDGLKILIEDDDGQATSVTKTIVYQEVLQYV